MNDYRTVILTSRNIPQKISRCQAQGKEYKPQHPQYHI